MKRIFTQSESKSLYTDVKTSFKIFGNISRINVFSDKCEKDTNFLKPYKYGSIRVN